MFDQLSERLGAIFDRLSGRGRVSEGEVNEALREVRVALLEADVSLGGCQGLRRARQRAGHRRRRARVADAGADDPQDRPRRARRAARPVERFAARRACSSPTRRRRSSCSSACKARARRRRPAKLALRLKEQGRRSLLDCRRRLSSRGNRSAQTLGKQIDLPVFERGTGDPVAHRARRSRRSQTPRALDRDHRYRRTPADRRSAHGRARTRSKPSRSRARFCSSPMR